MERTSFRPRNRDQSLPYDVCFFDPPYKMVNGVLPGAKLYKSLQRLGRDGITREASLLLFRTPTRSTFELPAEWEFERTMDYSTMEIHWYRRRRTEPSMESVSDGADPDPENDDPFVDVK